MKLQPTCSICLSKIKLIDLRYGPRRMGPGRKLLCKHVFHASCIDSIYKPQCPLCEHPIFNKDEEALLTCTSEENAISILKTLHERKINVKNIFTFLTRHESGRARYKWIVELMYKYCDFTELLACNLGDKALVKEIVTRGRVNWFKTFHGGLTFFDLVYERTDDPEVISLVYDKLPIDPENKPSIVRATSSPSSFTSDPPRYQRHRRMESMSGSTVEHQLWGASARPDIERTATVRRSLKTSRSIYPSLMTCHEEPLFDEHTYPNYERLYPALASAPPIELI